MISPAEPRAAASAGFTLIEIIIVLVVLSLVAGLVISRGPARSATVELRSAATRMLQGMRATRAQSIAAGRPLSFSVDPARHLYRVGEALPQPLPAGIAVAVVVAGHPARGIGFLPDGSSGGGVIELAGPTRRMDVTVDWLSGRMRVSERAP